MCIIIYAPNGSIPPAHLKRSFERNRDGWGYVFASAETGKLVARHGMTLPEFWQQWKRDKAARKNQPVVFHARIGTSGTMDVSNCHPFPVAGHGIWISHNGIIRAYHPEEDSEDKHLNDTRIFIRDILCGLPRGWQNNESIRRLVEHTIGGGNKLVLMDRTGKVTILNEWAGHWNAGRWYSNSSYLPAGGATADPRNQPAARAVLFGIPVGACGDEENAGADCIEADLTDDELAALDDMMGMPDFDPANRAN